MLPYQNLSLEDMPGEEWKEIPDYDGAYLVSNFGRIKATKRVVKTTNGTLAPFAERILKPLAVPGWYLSVMLSKNGKTKRYNIHRLVAYTFVENPQNKPCVDHIDTDRWNNNCNNLRWVTKRENCNNPNSFKNYSKAHSGEKSSFFGKRYMARAVVSVSPDGRVRQYDCIKDVIKDGYSYQGVTRCLRERKMYKGRNWYYLSDYVFSEK